MAGEACEEQAGRADRKRVKVLHVFAIGPGALVFEVWVDKFRGFRDAAAEVGAGTDDPYSEEAESRNNFHNGNEGPCPLCLPAFAAVLPCF